MYMRRDVHEKTHLIFSFYFLVFLSRFVKQLRTYHLLYQTTQFLSEQKYSEPVTYSLSSILILLDILAAFDTVNHSSLLSSLAATGISDTALDWIKSYLHGRSSHVTWSDNVSAPHPLVTAVPQSSVLSSSLCTLGPLVLSFLLMTCHTTVILMIPNSFSPFPHLTHRSLPGSLPA